ncbi:MAG: DUF4440 domain-containing protein [Verrucomicrobiota bacterium]|nr:DUF4440 domain-containing protein [Verrucomicrobiota bacterium]
MKPIFLIVISTLLFPFTAFAGFDASAEGQKLSKRDAEWADLATAGKDVEKVLSYWTDDAVMMMAGQPVITGKAAIRAFVTGSFQTPGFKIHWVSSKPVFSPDGKMAYMQGTEELTLPGPDGAPVVHQMRGVSIWRVDADGQWRCTMDISNEAPPAAAATAAK